MPKSSRREAFAQGAEMAAIRFGAGPFDRQRMLSEIAEGRHDKRLKEASNV